MRLDHRIGPGGEACPTTPALRDAVIARLGYDPFDETATTVVRVTFEARDKRLVARVEMTSGGAQGGAREIESNARDCVELGKAAVLAIVVAVDPFILDAPEASDVPVESSPPPASARSVEPRPLVVRRRDVALRLHGDVFAGVAVGSGFLPDVATGATTGVRFARGHAALSVEGQSYLATDAPSPHGGGVRAALARVLVAPCFRASPVFGCALASVGYVHGSGYGVRVPFSPALLYAAAGARAGIELKLSPYLELRLQADVEMPFDRMRFTIDQEVVWRSSVVAASGAALLGVDFL